MRSVRELYELQLLDWQIQELEVELSDVRAKLADDSTRVAAESRLTRLEKRLDELGPPRRQAEDAIQQIEERVSTIDSRMYSGTVTNPRELEAYQDERAMLTRNLRTEEDRLLEFLVEMEETQELRDAARTAFEAIDEQRNQEVAVLGSRQEELDTQLPGLKSRRQSLSSDFPPNVLQVYEMVRRSRGGQGAALVDRRGLCQGCRLVIPQSELSQVRSGDGIVQCGSCGRILVYE